METWYSSNRVKYCDIQAGASLASGDKRVYFVYRGDGKRAQMSTSTWNGSSWASTVNEYFLWADDEIIQKRVGATDSTTRTHYYDQGETRHTGTGTPTKHYYTKDHLGTIHGITSGTGTVEASIRYDPYGLRRALYGSASDRGYTGHWYFKPSTAGHAAAKEMYLAMYRMYDPVHGRWLSRDPIGENGGLNLYGYVGNGPVMQWDPYGLDDEPGFWRSLGRGIREALQRIVPGSELADPSIPGGGVLLTCLEARNALIRCQYRQLDDFCETCEKELADVDRLCGATKRGLQKL